MLRFKKLYKKLYKEKIWIVEILILILKALRKTDSPENMQ